MERLTTAIGRKDSRFVGKLVQVGSSFEGTRVGEPDEFDFNIQLIRFSDLFTANSPVPSTNPGFYRLQNVSSDERSKFQTFFSDDGFLLTTRVNLTFETILKQVLHESHFWIDEPYLEIVDDDAKAQFGVTPTKLCTTLTLRTSRRVNAIDTTAQEKYFYPSISVDIVPCLHINGYWPTEAVSSFEQATMEDSGCTFVFAQPSSVYEAARYSDTSARVSFAVAESRLMRCCPPVVKAAYMVGKWLLDNESRNDLSVNKASDLLFSSHVLKTALFFSIEETSQMSMRQNKLKKTCIPRRISRDVHNEKSSGVQHSDGSMYKDVNHEELTSWVRQIFQRLLTIAYQDYVPTFFMPSFRLPVWKFEKFVGYCRRRCVDYEVIFDSLTSPDDELSKKVEYSFAVCHLLYWSLMEEGADFPKVVMKPDRCL